VTWLSLDESDNDPAQLWVYFIASIQQLHSDLGKSALASLQSSQAPPINAVLTSLINDIIAFPDSFSSVLDDFHLIDSKPVHEALAFLLDHLPANMHMVITTRVDPPLPLARLRARGQMTENRARDLPFTPDEAAIFLNQVMGLNLSEEEVSALEMRTEGWIAGLQIAALSMQGHDDVSGFIQAFSGSHRHILGYLADEVINQQPKAILSFLLQTSILDRLCGPLCDTVTGETGGQEILENLERTNLFITPLDDESRWYRYHHLFAEVLQARLRQIQHGQIPELHRRAGNWFARQGMLDEAVQHELSGANFERAASLLDRVAGNMLRKGKAASLIRWLNALPDGTIRARPRLCLARGWSFVWGPEFSLERAEEWAQLALEAMQPGSIPDLELEGEVYALQALIAADRVDVALSRQLAQRALECLPAGSPWRGVTTFTLGAVLYAAGELSAAASVLTETVQLGQADGNLYVQLIAGNFLADIQVFQGHLGRAAELYRQVLAWGDHGIPQKGVLVAHAGLANVLCEQDQPEAALAHVVAGLAQLEQVGGPAAALWLYRSLARLQRAKGDWAAALEALERAYKSGQRAQIPFVVEQAAALRARLQLAQGDLSAAGQWLANSSLGPDDPQADHPGVREVEYLASARVLTAQDRHPQALALLDRLLASAESEGRIGSVIENLALQSLVFQSQGSTARALACLVRALRLAEPEGYVRVFVDEGDPMRVLISEFQELSRQKLSAGADEEILRLLAYTEKLLSAFSQPLPEAARAPALLPELLSERELEILRLIAEGCSNQEIAEILVIAVSTVKTHINNLYAKLGANRRTQAIAMARDLGLLPE
jgi:LuxR family maltose regulon positive regulatory protein